MNKILLIAALWPAVIVAASCTSSPYPPPMADCDGPCLPFDKDASLVKDALGLDASTPEASAEAGADAAKDASPGADASAESGTDASTEASADATTDAPID